MKQPVFSVEVREGEDGPSKRPPLGLENAHEACFLVAVMTGVRRCRRHALARAAAGELLTGRGVLVGRGVVAVYV
jgi:hypothetical protein